MLTIILGLVFKSPSKIAQDCPDLLLPRLQPPCSQHVLQPRIHARVGPVPGGAPGVVITAVQLRHAGPLQLRQQHHGAHHEPVRCSVVTSFNAGINYHLGIDCFAINALLQISPVNNNISKTGGGSFGSSGGTPPPPTPTHGMSGQTAGDLTTKPQSQNRIK